VLACALLSAQAQAATQLSSPKQADFASPGNGRVPLIIESAGVPQDVSLREGELEPQCRTPCRFYVPPGQFTFVASRGGSATVVVPESGLEMVMNSPEPGAGLIVGVATALVLGSYLFGMYIGPVSVLIAIAATLVGVPVLLYWITAPHGVQTSKPLKPTEPAPRSQMEPPPA
jgi:hypothetical protein